MSDTTPTRIETVIAARLEALILRAGSSVRSVSLQIGRPAHDLHRRLSLGSADRRPLRWLDVAEVLEALGLDALAILDPVLVGPDARVLAWIAAPAGATVADEKLINALFDEGPASLARLHAQELVRTDDATGAITLTPTGRKALALEPVR